MLKESNIRSIVKGFSWRFVATFTTILIVYFFFGRLDLAIAAGAVEWFAKIFLFWVHERIWIKIGWGKKTIEPFNLWFTGLPLSGKSTIADAVYKKLKTNNLLLQRIDSSNIRSLMPEIGFTRDERNLHLKRISHLVKTLHDNSVSTVCSFVSPYRESRKNIRQMVKNNIFVYIKAEIETCKNRDYKGIYEKAMRGDIHNFSGISDIYEEPQSAEIVIDTDFVNVKDATDIIVKYIKKNHLR